MVYTAVGGGAAGGDPFAPARRRRGAQGHADHQPDAARAERSGVRSRSSSATCATPWTPLPGARINVGLGGSAREIHAGAAPARTATLLAEPRARSSATCARCPASATSARRASLVRPELIVRPDFARAADLGVTAPAIGETLRIATAGDYDQGLAKLNLSQRQVPIVVKLPDAARADLACSAGSPVPGTHGPVMLGNVADAGDRRAARRRSTATIACATSTSRSSSTAQPLGEIQKQALALPSLRNLPPACTSDRPSATPRR